MQVGDRVKIRPQESPAWLSGMTGTIKSIGDKVAIVLDEDGGTAFVFPEEVLPLNVMVHEGVIRYTTAGVPVLKADGGEVILPLAGYEGKRIRITIEELD